MLSKRIFKSKDKLRDFISMKPEYLQPLYLEITDRIPEYKEGLWTVWEETHLPRTNQDKPPYEVGGYSEVRIEFEPFELG